MFRIAQRHTLQLWIALLAILFSALAPTISHALAPSTANSAYSIGAICSSDDSSTAPAGSMAACDYCLTQASNQALLPPAPAHSVLLEGHDAYPVLLARTAHCRQQRDTAQARGPPTYS